MDLEKEIKALTEGRLDKEARGKTMARLLWGDDPPEDESMPSVSAADIKAVWNMWREMQEHMSGQQVAIGVSVYKSLCSPNANVPAVNYRAAMLAHLEMQPIELPDAVFEVAAKFPMRRVRVGVLQQGLPFDIDELAKQVEQAVRLERK